MVLGFYTLPTVLSAYLYGRRHATLTALFSILLVILIQWFNPQMSTESLSAASQGNEWLEAGVWGGTLVLTGYFMGTLLYEHRNAQIKELAESYDGILVILRHFISKDKYTENHCYRVSVYAANLCSRPGWTCRRPGSRTPGRQPCSTTSASWISAVRSCTRPPV